MPVNRGQGRPTRWYRLCFVPISADSSDDSDTESVVLPHTSTPTSTSTWEQLPPPLPPPDPQPEIDWRFLPPPPPPPPLMSPPSVTMPAFFGIESSQLETYQPPSPIHPFVEHNNPISSFSVTEAGSGCCHPPQVPDGVMNAIRMVEISELHERDDKLSHCPICMEEFKVGDQACQLPCNHTYCSECILRWLNNNKTCPVCRLQLDGWEAGSDSNRGDTSLDPQPQIPVRHNHNFSAWEYFYPPNPDSQVPEDSAGDNSDEVDYDSACEELDDSNEDGDIVGASQSGRG